MNTEIVKTYMIVTGHNDPNNNSTTAVFSGDDPKNNLKFPEAFVSSTNRRYITVMPPKIVFADDDREVVNDQYIMHCSFIYRDPFHEKTCMPVNMGRRSKYKKYEYKANYDTFDIIFTHNHIEHFRLLHFFNDVSINYLKNTFIHNELANVIDDYNDFLDAMNNIQARVDAWKNDPNNPIDVGTAITPATEAIVPIFDGFPNWDVMRTETFQPPFIRPTHYMNIDIWIHAFLIEYQAYMRIPYVAEPLTVYDDDHQIYNDNDDDNYYEFTQVYYTHPMMDAAVNILILLEGSSYKLFSNGHDWSYYAEFMLQY